MICRRIVRDLKKVNKSARERARQCENGPNGPPLWGLHSQGLQGTEETYVGVVDWCGVRWEGREFGGVAQRGYSLWAWRFIARRTLRLSA